MIGGNFIDWYMVVELIVIIGYFIVEVFEDGMFICMKLVDIGGVVNVGMVLE